MHYTEIAAVILGLASVYLVIKQNIFCYPLGILSVAFYVYIFYNVQLYADMGLQIAFIFLQCYGWYKWLYGGEQKTKLKISPSSWNIQFVLLLGVALSTFSLGWTLQKKTDAALPYWDSLQTSLSLAGQWMSARKYIENWLVWIIVNIVSVGMYYAKDLHFTMVLYAVYLALAFLGWFEWKRQMKISSTLH
jgi:nicotinamide mononucleotide transporter